MLTANRAFQGHLEGVLEGRLNGWTRHVGGLQPVLLDLLMDGKPAATFHAGEFRGNLLAANLGNGNHAFFHDLSQYAPRDEAIIRVRVNGKAFELANSDRSFGELKALRG